MKTMTKKNLISLSCALALVAIGGGVALREDFANANELSLTGASMVVDGAELRLAKDGDETGNGLRFVVKAPGATALPQGTTATGTLVIPTALLEGELTVDNEIAYDFDTTAAWNVYEEDGAYSYAYFWNMSEYSYNVEFTYRGYVVIDDETFYTETATAVLADEALEVYNNVESTENQKEIAESFLLDYTVTYDVDGDQDPTEKVAYGEMVDSVPVAPVKEGYVFDGWYLGDEKFDAENDVVKGDITLTAKYKDLEETIEEGTFGFSGLSMTIALDKENVYGDSDTAVKVTTVSGQYKTDEGSLNSQELFGNLQIGDTISYYLKALKIQTSSAQNGTYTDVTTLGMNKLLNPIDFDKQGTYPAEILKADGSVAIASGIGNKVENVITVGEWYKITYVATANTFKNFTEKCGRMHLFQYGINEFVKGEWVIDGIKVTKGSDLENTVWEGVIGIDGLSMSVAKTNDSYNGGVALKVSTLSGPYKTCSGTMTSAMLFGNLTAGQTISYYIKATNVKTSATKTGEKADANTITVSQLLNPASWTDQLPSSVTKADGTPITDSAITGNEVLEVGEWYKVSYVTTGVSNDSNNTTFKYISTSSGMACWMQFGSNVWMSADWIIDGITVS